MIVLALLIFGFCLWAVFSRHFCDGLVVKHLLTFSAITAMLFVLDPINYDTITASILMLVAGIVYWFVKHLTLIREYFELINH